MVKAISSRLAEILEAAGAREVHVEKCTAGASSHYLGTCRMGKDPQASVVDPWCRSHDVPNLFIGDGSVFVTAGGGNSALLISALGTRTAGGILTDIRR